jgi:hypothetical protein
LQFRSASVSSIEAIDFIIRNTGYGLFGVAEELSDAQIAFTMLDQSARADPVGARRAAPARIPVRQGLSLACRWGSEQ